MELTKEIRNAVRLAINEHGKAAILADKCGVTDSALSNYVNGINEYITDKTAKKLMPYIGKYLTSSGQQSESTGQCQRCAGLSGEALDLAKRWDRLCPDQRKLIVAKIEAYEDEEPLKKGQHSLSREHKKTA